MSLVVMSGNQDIDGVLWGVKWDLATLTYGFATQTSQYFGYQVGTITGFEAFNATQKAAGTDAVNQLASLVNLGITLASDPSQANLRFAEASSVNQRFDPITFLPTPGVITTAVGTPPDDFKFPTFGHGDMFFNNTNYNTPVKGSFAYATVIHELGHAVGLKHGHITQNFPNDSFVIPALPAAHDSMEFSIMTYRSNEGGPSDHYRNEDFGYAQTWMMNDIAALQYLYGADFTANAGNTKYSWNRTTGEMLVNGVGQGTPGANRVFLTIWDGNGIDTYDMANYTAKVTINLNPGSFSITSQDQLAVLNTDDGVKARGNVFNALQVNGDVRSLIENALGGSGDDTITGNVAANDLRGNGGADTLNGLDGADKLFGGDGNDTLNGGTGADTMEGGLGNDTYIVDNAADTVSETSAAATEIDTVRSSVSFTLGAHVEKLVLTGKAAIAGTGNTLANTITGNAAANTLDGGAGNDILDGGLGNDTYVLADGADKVIDSGGIDRITSTITRSLAGFATIENLTLLGSAAINATGNALANVLTGNAAANTLDGGAGNDTLDGGLGDDTYVLADGADKVIDSGGIDRITSTITRSLAGFATIENLTLLGSAAINATGNALANTITGNAAANTLDGGAGNDILDGGLGNDTYVLADGADKIIDSGGIDRITSTITRSLAGFAAIENLTLLGNAAINATGNALANVLTGNAAANTLNGGVGNDILDGGLGNDTYVLADGADKVIDSGGIDRITSTITRSLAGFAAIENLTLLGSAAINATGNALANILTGNAGNNRLDGGAGNDTLKGGAGNDIYFVDASGDKAFEATGGGSDTLRTSVTYALAAGSEIELFTTTNSALTAAINLTGNSFAQTIQGNAGKNTINGGAGADRMIGLGGSDRYIVDSVEDVVDESVAGSSGADTVLSAVTFNLGDALRAKGAIEKLTLTGSGAIAGTGNSLANTIVGNGAANALDGGAGNDTLTGNAGNDTLTGGAGRDTLTGGTGLDVFDFNSLADSGITATTRDLIADFTHAEGDRIDLSTIDAIQGGADNAFTFLAAMAAPFTAAGQVRFAQSGGHTFVEMNTDTNFSTFESSIEIGKLVTLVASDFVL